MTSLRQRPVSPSILSNVAQLLSPFTHKREASEVSSSSNASQIVSAETKATNAKIKVVIDHQRLAMVEKRFW